MAGNGIRRGSDDTAERKYIPVLRRRAVVIFLCVALGALGAIGATLWNYFGVGGIRNYSSKPILFVDSDLQLPKGIAGNTGRIRVVHFWDPNCRQCTKETDAHLNYLIEMFRGSNIDFYSVRKPGTHGELPSFLKGKLTPLPWITGMDRIPASPAIAIWAADGKLAYVGPYSQGLVCSSANSFVEPVLNRLVAGEHVEPFATVAVGCYCPWMPDAWRG